MAKCRRTKMSLSPRARKPPGEQARPRSRIAHCVAARRSAWATCGRDSSAHQEPVLELALDEARFVQVVHPNRRRQEPAEWQSVALLELERETTNLSSNGAPTASRWSRDGRMLATRGSASGFSSQASSSVCAASVRISVEGSLSCVSMSATCQSWTAGESRSIRDRWRVANVRTC